jgi:hypothetical protein
MRGENCGLWIADCGLCRIHSAIRNPKSEIRNRRGITLTEVLISMGILTIGLLGVAALFPVGSYYLQKGETADRGSALAQAAFNDVVARGMLNPEHWIVWRDAWMPGDVATTPIPDFNQMFVRPFAKTLRTLKTSLTITTSPSAIPFATIRKILELEHGSVFVIDPVGIASVAELDSISGAPVKDPSKREYPGIVFPASASRVLFPTSLTNWPPQWHPWIDNTSHGPDARWPIRRVTFRQAIVASPFFKPLSPAVAGRMLSTTDDLALELPDAQDQPAIQRWELANLSGPGTLDPLARQSRGDYSWIVTVAPTSADARDALATDPAAHNYEVSVVVFHKRPVEATSPTDVDGVLANAELLINNERSVNAKIISTGLSGGEVLLTRVTPGTSAAPVEPEENPFNILKEGHWVMLCGPHPASSDRRPMMVARWYRVLSIEGNDTRLNDQGNESPPPPATDPERRLVALRGPQWPWQPAADLADANELSNRLYLCIPTGAVAVHAKTIRIEGTGAFSF